MKVAREYLRSYGLLLLALLPLICLRDFTPANELRYLSIADEALRNHTFFTFSHHGVAYADKPPLYLWLVMLCRYVAGGHYMWLLSMFSVLPALGVVCLMDRWVGQELDSASRAVARLALFTSGFFIGSVITVRMDMLMCLFIILALRSFWRMYQQPDGGSPGDCRKERWLFPVWLFLALFTKGPYGLLIPLAGTVVYLLAEGRIRQLGRYWGWRTWGVLLAGCGLWFWAVYAEGGTEYLNNLLFHQTVDRAVHSFRHDKPAYYYAVSFWYSLAPWSLLAFAGGMIGLRHYRRQRPLLRFFLLMGFTSFVLLSCISSKLDIYMLPAFPFFIYAAAMSLRPERHSRWMRLSMLLPALAFLLALPGLLVAARTVPYLQSVMFYVAGLILSLCGLVALVQLYRNRTPLGYLRTVGYGFLLAVFCGGWAMPTLNGEIGYSRLCQRAGEVARQRGIGEVYAWRLPHSDDIDVYLSLPLRSIPKSEEPVTDPQQSSILLTSRSQAGRFAGCEVEWVGSYALVICPPVQ